MFCEVGNDVLELSNKSIEWIVGLEYILSDPKISIGDEHFTIEIISDSASVLDITSHVLHSFEGHVNTESSALSHVLLNIKHGCLKIRVVELVGDTETERTELSTFLHN